MKRLDRFNSIPKLDLDELTNTFGIESLIGLENSIFFLSSWSDGGGCMISSNVLHMKTGRATWHYNGLDL